MTEARAEIRRVVRECLCAITDEPTARMRWVKAAYMRDVVARYRVRIEGWPLEDMPFQNPCNLSSVKELKFLILRWTEGKTYFRKITECEFQCMVSDPTPWIGGVEGGQEAGDDV
ncbi:hypothetical protein ONZ51_g7005 [Trametes cubensis]|uniref:Uncharacterized protein n=1 Tax=Trametes cubensis TaxID=1111947 RepID=A0AAD7TQZ6_9APHY|nr:hypothetical protein ONZ51_g7005 [Trametes cubensis]